ncbi:MAG: class I SAM-dependent methyltransferase [Myxococcales bacterium]|nr:class I SAM-dependent methyltransferase [Myxococcales bacterium]
MGAIIDLLKRVPIDLGQGAVAEKTEGKQIALRLVPPGDGRAALDLGARDGHQTRWLRGRGYTVTSVDVDPQFPECLAVDANAPLPFPDAAFDLVWSSEVIEHLEDPAASLAELRRVTRPGGDIILTTPNSYMWLFRLIARFGLTPDRIQRADHLHFFDLGDIRRLAPDARLYGYFPYLGPKRTLQRPGLVGQLSPTFVIHIRP